MVAANATPGSGEPEEELEYGQPGEVADEMEAVNQLDIGFPDQGLADLAVRVSGSPPGPEANAIRPFLLLDAKPEMRSRFENCCVLRAELAEQAATTWLKEFREPVLPVSWPAALDGVNCRGALRVAQTRDPQLAAIVKQLQAASGSANDGDAKFGWLKSN